MLLTLVKAYDRVKFNNLEHRYNDQVYSYIQQGYSEVEAHEMAHHDIYYQYQFPVLEVS